MPDPVDPDPVDATLAVSLPGAERRAFPHVNLRKVGLFVLSLFLFIMGIAMMKEGAVGLAPLVQNFLAVDNPANSMGFGWLAAYLIMSGSPVAASALAFFDSGIINSVSAFTMIAGSRMGAGFIVLLIGFLYVLRGRDRATSLAMGLLSLCVTISLYLVSLPLGLWLMNRSAMARLQIPAGMLLQSVLERTLQPALLWLSSWLPLWLLFASGLGIILLSLSLFDRCLPVMSLKESQVGRLSRLVYRPWVMLLLGAGVTLISMSVSMSLSLLVPLSERGFVRRENAIPYIMGANVTTFIDTLFASLLLNNPIGTQIVLAAMLSIFLVSLLVLSMVFQRYERWMLALVQWVTTSSRHLLIFILLIFVIPIILFLV
jgi:sodium-dependent phosphate cotransporter